MRILIIRFSSMGDIVQAMAVTSSLLEKYPEAQIEWVTKKEFTGLLSLDSRHKKIWQLERQQGLKGLLKLALELRQSEKVQAFELIYDAHQNVRSLFLKAILRPLWLLGFGRPLVMRSKERWKRFLLFFLRINLFPRPYRGMLSYLRPLEHLVLSTERVLKSTWSYDELIKNKVTSLLPSESYIALAPSAAWEMKRWPVSHWIKLIELMPEEKFVLLGGPEDIFLQPIQQKFATRVTNLAGKLSLIESSYAVLKSKLLVSADTGLIHIADLQGHPGISLMGPTAFGFCSSDKIKTLEVDLPCRPCTKDGRGRCSRAVYQECMVLITPEKVVQTIHSLV